MKDPLFRIGKILNLLQSLLVGDDIGCMEGMNVVNKAVGDGNSIAFVKANAGGGKDRVELLIERSRNFVVAIMDGLDTLIQILGLNAEIEENNIILIRKS